MSEADSYNFDDDIENVMPKKRKANKSDDDEEGQEEGDLLVKAKSTNQIAQPDPTENEQYKIDINLIVDYRKNYLFRTLNVLSLVGIIGLVTYAIVRLFVNKKMIFGEFLNVEGTEVIHFQIDLIAFYISWGCIIVFSFISIFRHFNWFTNRHFSKFEEFDKILFHQMRLSFFFGNIFFIAFLVGIEFFGIDKYGLVNLPAVIALVFYIYCYLQVGDNYVMNTGYYNFISTKVVSSMIMSWSGCLFITSVFATLESHKDQIGMTLDISAGIVHLSLCAILVMLITRYNDLYSCSIILLYQVGLVITHSSDKKQFDYKFGIVMLVFNIICFFWVLVGIMKKDKNELEEENQGILSNYNKCQNDQMNL